MKVIILCGGEGIRAFPFTSYLPKPMLPVKGSPIIVQVIKSFIAQGFDEFILAAGYRKSVLDDYFEGKDLGAKVDVVDTGEYTDTGGRVYACRDLVGDDFMVTYADGLCDVPLDRLVGFHKAHDGLATITTVPMNSQYGVINMDEDSGKVTALREKPRVEGHWINAGFIVLNRKAFDHWAGDNLEKDVFPAMTAKGLVYAYRHNGFFKSLDNYKDLMEFEGLLNNGETPWAVKKETL